jgi:6-phosphofructokinase 1
MTDDILPENFYEEMFELAGPREKIFFEPKKIKSAIVTCGGLCPGINDVIRAIVMESYYRYGSTEIYGIRYGYGGLHPDTKFPPIKLTPEMVGDIHRDGGTFLSSSRGGTEDMNILVDTLVKLGINILYTIGGDGTLRGANKFSELALERGLNLAVVGIPKTIDNDISFIQRTFGFETAFSEAVNAIKAAHVEAKGAPNGIGLVKLMGRHSGFIAANATIASNEVNYVFVPEVQFKMDGEKGFLNLLENRIVSRGHAVVCVAEGAGQDILATDASTQKKDASGNVVLQDVGAYFKKRISDYFNEKNIEINLKYIDPSYMIRSQPAVPADSIYCTILGQNAVHAGMAGKTGLMIGQWNNIYTNVPIELATSVRKTINPESMFWFNVLESTGQPADMK